MMKHNARAFKTLLRYLALFCFFLTPFPVFSIVVQKCALPFPYLLFSALLLEVCGFIAFALRALLEHLKLRPYLVTLLLIFFGGILGAGSFFLLYRQLSDLVYTAILTAALLILYGCSARVAPHPYAEVLSKFWFFLSIGINLIVILVAKIRVVEPFSYEPQLVVFLFGVAVFAVILNQQSIDTMMERRGHSTSQLPPKIRYYNMIVVAVVLAVTLGLILLREPVINGTKALFSAIGSAVGRALLWFGGLFMSEGGMPEEEEAVSSRANEFLEIGESGDADASRVFMLLFFALVLIVSIRPLFRKIRALFSKLIMAIKRWIRRERKSSVFSSEENEYYSDTDETLDRDGKVIEDLSPARALRNWKRELKAFSKLPPSPEKLRLGYRLSVEGLELHGVAIEAGNTQLEILQKARARLRGGAFEAATWCYDALVFGGIEEDLKLPQMEESLEQIRSLPVIKKKE